MVYIALKPTLIIQVRVKPKQDYQHQLWDWTYTFISSIFYHLSRFVRKVICQSYSEMLSWNLLNLVKHATHACATLNVQVGREVALSSSDS